MHFFNCSKLIFCGVRVSAAVCVPSPYICVCVSVCACLMATKRKVERGWFFVFGWCSCISSHLQQPLMAVHMCLLLFPLSLSLSLLLPLSLSLAVSLYHWACFTAIYIYVCPMPWPPEKWWHEKLCCPLLGAALWFRFAWGFLAGCWGCWGCWFSRGVFRMLFGGSGGSPHRNFTDTALRPVSRQPGSFSSAIYGFLNRKKFNACLRRMNEERQRLVSVCAPKQISRFMFTLTVLIFHFAFIPSIIVFFFFSFYLLFFGLKKCFRTW